jgi:hypothetical protein
VPGRARRRECNPVPEGVRSPVLQVQNADAAVVYTLRINSESFTPAVREPGVYTVVAFDLDGITTGDGLTCVHAGGPLACVLIHSEATSRRWDSSRDRRRAGQSNARPVVAILETAADSSFQHSEDPNN